MTRLYSKTILVVLSAVVMASCQNGSDTAEDSVTLTPAVAVYSAAVDEGVPADEPCSYKPTAKKIFKKEQSDTLECKGAALYVREHTLTEDKEFSITALTESEMAELPDEIVNVTGEASGFRFLPHGVHFTIKEAIIRIPYDSLKIPQGYSKDDINTYFYNESDRRWEVLETDTIDSRHQIAYARTTHFTDMVNGILKVPESPETGALTPTFIRDYEPVNPASGIVTIQAPAPDASGCATLAYPFKIPEGRKGVTPHLSLRYNSSVGSSWVGYGFSIPVEKIEIDTRWGAPLFREDKESECYMLGGIQFTEKAHNHIRIDSLARVRGDRQYYLRTDSEFLNVIRHGSTPKDYSWTVTDKNGIEKTFTGFDGYSESVDVDTEPTEHNQIEWVLTKVRDRHGNTILYTYINRSGTLYPETVTYTGYEGEGAKEAGVYKLEFVMSDKERSDKLRSFRLGTDQTDGSLLDRIIITNGGETVRSYTFEYVTGAFSKTMLKKVSEYDSGGELFYSHGFDYYNDTKDGLFSDAQTWTSEGSGLMHGSYFDQGMAPYTDELSMINGAWSDGYSVGGGAHVSVGIAGFCNVYAGTSYQYARNETKGVSALADINGDGLPDLVFTRNDTLMFLPSLDSVSDSGHRFGKARPILSAPEKSISKGVSETHNLLLDAGAQVFFISGNVCYSHNWQKSETKVYLHDFNSDGLADIAFNGTVWFNHIDESGVPVFTRSSTPTPCPIPGLDIPIDNKYIPDVEHIKDSMSRMFPRHDVVRVWRAPYDGTIEIGPDIVLATSGGDGVNVSVQAGMNVKWTKKIKSGASENMHIGTLKVAEGERIYFRTQSVFDAANDATMWDPTIKYKSVGTNIEEGENGKLTHYKASDQFLFCGVPDMPLHKEGSVHIEAPFSKGVLTDDICLVVRKSAMKIEGGDTTIVSADIERRYLRAGEEYRNEPMDIYLTVDGADMANNAYLSFIVECNSQILWERIKWRPVATYVGETVPFMHVAPKYTMYNRHIKVAPSVKNSKNGVVSVKLNFEGECLDASDADRLKINFSLKNQDGVALYSGPYAQGMSIDVDLTDSRLLYGSFHADKELSSVTSAVFTIDGHESEASVYCAYNDESMGHLYSGWGQFAYNGEGTERADEPIKESELGFDTNDFSEMINTMDKGLKPENVDTTKINLKKLVDLPSVKDQNFFIMAFVPKNERYESVAKDSYVSGTETSPSRIGAQTINVDVPSYPDQFDPSHPEDDATACPIQKVQGQGDGFTASVGAVATVGGGYGKTNSYSVVSLLDINGDSYPDWINGDEKGITVQYTQGDGRLTEYKGSYEATPSHVVSKSENLTAGVSFSSTTPDEMAAIGKKENWSMKNQQKASDEGNRSSAAISANGNFSKNSSVSNCEFVDINGDGLPDLVSQSQKVRYNIGGREFREVEDGRKPSAIYDESAKSTGGGMGVNVSICGKASVGGGVSCTSSEMTMNDFWQDMNGDGLPDYIHQDGANDVISITFNDGVSMNAGTTHIAGVAGRSVSSSQSVNCNVSGIIPIFMVNLAPSVNSSYSKGTSSTRSTIVDVNGDGYPDIVESSSSNSMRVRLSNIRRTNRLRRVVLPFGGEIEMDYAVAKHNYNMPTARWVMSKVEVRGGSEELGATSRKDSIAYIGGVYNRCERTFLGFDTVRVSSLDTENKDSVMRTVSTAYLTNSFYSRNLPSEVRVSDGKGKRLSAVRYEYTMLGDSSFRGAGVFPAMTKESTVLYGEEDVELACERTFAYDESGNITKYTVDGDLNAQIEYHKSDLVRNAVSRISVGELRERTSEIDEKTGDITRITVSTGTADAIYDMEYDEYGNIIKMTGAENEKGERVWTKLKYDERTHSMIEETHDSYGLKSKTEYDPLFNLPLKTTDANSNEVTYTYDTKGRLTTVTAPKEAESGSPYTLRFEYITDGKEKYGVSYHNTPDGEFAVRTYIDSLCRPKYTERIAMLYTGGGSIEQKTVRSGYSKLDALWRSVAEIKPSVAGTEAETAVTTTYDALDRPLTVTQKDGTETNYTYSVTDDETAGGIVLKTTVKDARGGVADKMTDSRGRIVGTVRHHQSDEGEHLITVQNKYDAMNQLLKVIHPDGTESTYKYDKTGNVTEYTTPDAGKVTMTYTPQGQIKSRTTATGEKTEYGYDYGRLSTITYENRPQDAVTYTYADSTAAEPNSKGRLTEVKDPSGTERYTYGSMGEVIKTERTLNIDPQTGTVHSYTYGAAYDSWGRVREMTYPDGETVTYQYYPTGELRNITGESENGGETYLDRAGYDPYGRTVYRKMGNGTEHTYTYDINERLKSATLTLHKDIISTNTYTYDKTDNITGIRGVSESLYNQKYTYDDINRLTGASGMDTGGKSDDGSAFSSYVMTMSYDQMSSPQRYELTKMSQSDTKVTENEYLYSTDSSNPHAPMQIGDTRYTYSASGNPLTIEGSKISRTLTWDSENRLRELTDQRRGIQSRYTYNHRGERSLKRYGAYESMAVNGAAAGSLLDPKSAYSAYVSPYYVEHGRGTESGAVTKHYYAGAERLASKVVTRTSGTHGEGLSGTKGLTPSGAQSSTQSSAQTEESTYYYFTDHLGSTTYITDRSGRTSQYAAYTPYGELFREYKKVLPYKFNGKELDQETGYYYYGARYYDPGTALWFGVDPLAHINPQVSPYVYCNANPVKNIDADGNIPTAVVGAIIGATVNATIAAIEGKSGSEIMAAAAGGAVSGAIIGSGIGVSTYILGAVSGVAGDAVEQGLNIAAGTSYEYDAEGTIIAAISGAAFGKIGKEAKDIIKSTGEVAIKSIESRFSNNRIFNKVLNEVKSDFKSAGKPTQGHVARSQMNTEAKSRLKNEKSFQIGVSEIKTKLKEHGVDVSTGTAGTLINHKLSTFKDE